MKKILILNGPNINLTAGVTGEYRRTFRTIEYAVYCTPRDERNFLAFQSAMAQL